jgi:hypothetical protein
VYLFFRAVGVVGVKLSGQFGVAKEEEIRTTESQFWDFELDAKKVKAWMDMAHRGRWR